MLPLRSQRYAKEEKPYGASPPHLHVLRPLRLKIIFPRSLNSGGHGLGYTYAPARSSGAKYIGGIFMVPKKTDPRWKALLQGNVEYQFKMVAAGLCVARNRRIMAKDSSPAALEASLDEVYGFFEKYESILADDISAIFG